MGSSTLPQLSPKRILSSLPTEPLETSFTELVLPAITAEKVADQVLMVGRLTRRRGGHIPIRIVATEDGIHIETDQRRPRQLGTVESNGDFRLRDGTRGNIFTSSRFCVALTGNAEANQHGELLARWQRAYADWTIGDLRRDLAGLRDSRGRPIDGTGVRVTVIEPGGPQDATTDVTNPRHSPHARQTCAIIGDRRFGVAPGATVEVLALTRPDRPRRARLVEVMLETAKLPDNMAALERLIDEMAANVPTEVAARLDQLRARPADRRPHIVNLSIGETVAGIAEVLGRVINMSRNEGEAMSGVEGTPPPPPPFLHPRLRAAVLGEWPTRHTPREEHALVLDFVARRLYTSMSTRGIFGQSLTRYREAVRDATAAGMTIVVAAGNERENVERYQRHLRLRSGIDTNFLAIAPEALIVAACESRRDADRVTEFSSFGVGGMIPDFAAPGRDILNPFRPMTGTSASAPYTSGVVALMLQVNPLLTPSRMEEILSRTARRLTSPRSATGAGAIDPLAAVRAAVPE